MAEKGVGNLVQLSAQPALVDEKAHQDEQRNHRKPIVLSRVDDQPSDHRNSAPERVQVHVPDHANQPHRKGDRHAQENESEDRCETD